MDEFDDHLCEKPSYICNVCGKSFKSLFIVRQHHKCMHEEVVKKFGCDTCGNMFRTAAHLKDHMRRHEEKKVCPHCGGKYSRLEAHIAAVHLPDELKKCQCPDCGKGFAEFSMLKQHQISVHLQTRPYACRFGCDARFNDKSNRRQHERKTHGAPVLNEKSRLEDRLE